MTVEMINVESSNIRRIGYNRAAQRLYIEFKGGATYRYSDVDPETYAALMGSESMGRGFQVLIKSNPERYPYVKLDLEPGEEE